MERKYSNLKAYFNDNQTTVEDMKQMILENALALGCNAEKNFEGDVHETVQIFNTLTFFNEILDVVE